MFKATDYFAYTRSIPDRAAMRDEWIVQAIEHPVAEAVPGDGRLRRWAYISVVGWYLRVVLLPDALTVHNAFFDRRLEP